MFMESFVYHPCGMYQSFRGSFTPSRSRDPPVKQPSWKQSKSSGISPFLGGPFTPRPSDYLDSFRQSQLQALLSQVSPGPTPRLQRASTKEVGVQVSLRTDAAVQCSLGPRTLPAGRPSALRTLALYSPVANGRFFTLPETPGPQKDKASETTPEKRKEEDGSGEQQDGQEEAAVPSEEASERARENAPDPRRRGAFQVQRWGAGAWGEVGPRAATSGQGGGEGASCEARSRRSEQQKTQWCSPWLAFLALASPRLSVPRPFCCPCSSGASCL